MLQVKKERVKYSGCVERTLRELIDLRLFFFLMQVKKERVKYSSWLHKQCQHTLLVYVDFLWRRLPLAEYAKQVEALYYYCMRP